MLDLLNGFVGELRNAGASGEPHREPDAMEAVQHIPIDDAKRSSRARRDEVNNNAHWLAHSRNGVEVYSALRGPSNGDSTATRPTSTRCGATAGPDAPGRGARPPTAGGNGQLTPEGSPSC